MAGLSESIGSGGCDRAGMYETPQRIERARSCERCAALTPPRTSTN